MAQVAGRCNQKLACLRSMPPYTSNSFLERIVTPIRGLGLVTHGVDQGHLGDFGVVVDAFGNPIANDQAETVDGQAAALHPL